MKVVYSPRCLEHYSPHEPKERVGSVISYLEKNAEGKVELVPPAEIDENDLLLVHSKKMIEDLKFRSATGLGLSDNPFDDRTFDLAKIACGCALRGAEIADEEGFAFAITRPPGHHAGSDFYHGFCYMNNLAFAIRKNQNGRKAMVVDFDVHHGNGTQDIFQTDKSVFFFSMHQDPRTLFPFRSGFRDENNDHICNVPLAPGSGDKEVLEALKEGLEAGKKFGPDFIGVSAGFDMYAKDSISSVGIERTGTYSLMGREIKKMGLPVFSVLEGGYYLPDLGRNVWEFISAFE